jgi:hypothetical protein
MYFKVCKEYKIWPLYPCTTAAWSSGSSPTATEEIGAMDREIKSRQGIGRKLLLKNLCTIDIYDVGM